MFCKLFFLNALRCSSQHNLVKTSSHCNKLILLFRLFKLPFTVWMDKHGLLDEIKSNSLWPFYVTCHSQMSWNSALITTDRHKSIVVRMPVPRPRLKLIHCLLSPVILHQAYQVFEYFILCKWGQIPFLKYKQNTAIEKSKQNDELAALLTKLTLKTWNAQWSVICKHFQGCRAINTEIIAIINVKWSRLLPNEWIGLHKY